MDPVIGSALIGAGSSLLGGLMGKKANPGRDTRHVILNQVGTWREAGERFGFNPLTVAQASGGTVAPGGSDPNYMGNAIADAGMILADAWAKRTDAQKLQRSNERIKELQTKLDHQTLRPKVGGVYAQREMSPMLPAANGGSNGQNASSVPPSGGSARIPDGDNAWFGRGLSTKSALDDRRKVDNQDIKTHPGVMVLDNPNLPFDIYVPTLDGDEALTFNELPGLLAAGAATAGVHAVRGARGMYNLFADPHSGKRPKMAGGRVKSPKKNSAGKRPFQP